MPGQCPIIFHQAPKDFFWGAAVFFFFTKSVLHLDRWMRTLLHIHIPDSLSWCCCTQPLTRHSLPATRRNTTTAHSTQPAMPRRTASSPQVAELRALCFGMLPKQWLVPPPSRWMVALQRPHPPLLPGIFRSHLATQSKTANRPPLHNQVACGKAGFHPRIFTHGIQHPMDKKNPHIFFVL